MSINEMAVELVELAGSQSEAARLSGVSQPSISRLCAGVTGNGVAVDTAGKIKKALTRLRRSNRKIKNG